MTFSEIVHQTSSYVWLIKCENKKKMCR